MENDEGGMVKSWNDEVGRLRRTGLMSSGDSCFTVAGVTDGVE